MNVQKILFIGAVILFLISCFSVIVAFFIIDGDVVDEKEYTASLFVKDFYGFDVNGTAFTFGAVLPGGASKRSLEVNNTFDFPIEVEIIPEGDIAQFVMPNITHIDSKGSGKILIEAVTPQGIQQGEYWGKIKVLSRRVAE